MLDTCMEVFTFVMCLLKCIQFCLYKTQTAVRNAESLEELTLLDQSSLVTSVNILKFWVKTTMSFIDILPCASQSPLNLIQKGKRTQCTRYFLLSHNHCEQWYIQHETLGSFSPSQQGKLGFPGAHGALIKKLKSAR